MEFINVLPQFLGNAAFHFHAPVMPAVVPAADHFYPFGIGTGNPYGYTGGIGSGFHKNGHFGRGDQFYELFSQSVLYRLCQGKTKTFVPHLYDNRIVDLFFPVTNDNGTVCAKHIDVFVSVHIGNPAPFGMVKINGIFAGNKIIRTADSCDSAGNDLQGVFIHFFGNFQFQFLCHND